MPGTWERFDIKAQFLIKGLKKQVWERRFFVIL
jgi:hypothetical protein